MRGNELLPRVTVAVNPISLVSKKLGTRISQKPRFVPAPRHPR